MPRPTSLPRAIANRLRSSPRAYWIARRAYTTVNRFLPPRVVEGVPGPVHRNDLMFDGSTRQGRAMYLGPAVAAVELVRDAVEAVGSVLAEADVLDFGCGHGRVVRHLVTEAASVSACDLDHEGVRFCAHAFGAVPVLGHADIADVALADYDAIWAGSVITHHPPDVCATLLEGLADHVRPGGVLVVTSADAETLDDQLNPWGPAWLHDHEREIRRGLDRVGAAYVPYPQSTGGSYGLGFQTNEWLDGVVRGRGFVPLFHRPRGWVAQTAIAWHRPGATA